MKYEYCCNCSEPTGKAGAGDDSLYTDNDGPFCEDCFPDKERPQRKPLTDEQILHFVDTHVGAPSMAYPLDNSDWMNFARAIEAAHGIKE